MDREKVIKGLNYCTHTDGTECPNCPYWQDDDCVEALNADALALLKEQKEEIENLKQTAQSMMEGVCLLKEQEAVEWINVKDRLPKKDGQYLVVYTFFNYKGMGVVRFSHNLHEVDEYIFGEENRPGWYEPDDEIGYFERTTVTHWAKLPEFPKEGR